MDVIYDWVKNIVIYMILNTIIMNLLGNNSYKKYVSIVSGMILVLIVILPLVRAVDLDKSLDYFMMSNNLTVEASSFKQNINSMEEKQRDAILNEYERKLRAQVEDILKIDGVSLIDLRIAFDQNIMSSTFGEILQMNITVGKNTQETNPNKLQGVAEIEIDPIRIDSFDIRSDASKDKSGDQTSDFAEVKTPSPLEIKIKKRLSDFYYIEPDNINISIQGG